MPAKHSCHETCFPFVDMVKVPSTLHIQGDHTASRENMMVVIMPWHRLSFKIMKWDHNFLLRPWKKRCFLLLECFRYTLDMMCGEKQTLELLRTP
uniref:Uncharacterized protein n=1 Tax=Arundo donax TaxID=35708 RepID=A0A0A9EDB9_ARUDO